MIMEYYLIYKIRKESKNWNDLTSARVEREVAYMFSMLILTLLLSMSIIAVMLFSFTFPKTLMMLYVVMGIYNFLLINLSSVLRVTHAKNRK